MEILIVIGYISSLILIFFFSLGQFNLTLHYRKKTAIKDNGKTLDNWPIVTVQLPIYNEQYVVERLIDGIVALDYDQKKLQIQILDDSTDETRQLIADKISQYQAQGIWIEHVRRNDRQGFKAGALGYGTELAKGEFIAVFDADFLPEKDFLRKTIPQFTEDNIGMVQTRWGHINKDYSVLTRMQAFGLDAHFTVEQAGRNKAGSFISFNGTAGVWRKDCINDSGGWSAETLTEDLDLSYRAQLKGWRFKYLEDVIAPAELPVLLPAVKSQQYRWNKGAAETAKKNLGNIFKSGLKPIHKIHATFHLMNSSVFLLLLVAGLLSIPMLFIKESNPELRIYFDLGSVFLLGFFAIAFFYWTASSKVCPKKTLKYYLFNFPLFLAFSMGLSLHNAIAVGEGLLGIKTPFVRTPKFNILNQKDSWKGNKYINWKISPSVIFETLLAFYFIAGIASGIYLHDFGLLIFHLMLAIGFGAVSYLSLRPLSYAHS